MDLNRGPRPATPGLFADAEPAPPIERREWSDRADDAQAITDTKERLRTRRTIGTGEATAYADRLARQTVRRELVALRRRAEQWAATRVEDHGWEYEDEEDPAIEILRDLVTALDERIGDRGGVERGVPGAAE